MVKSNIYSEIMAYKTWHTLHSSDREDLKVTKQKLLGKSSV